MHFIQKISLIVSIALCLNGCAPAIVGGVAVGGMAAMRDKRLSSTIDDTGIETSIQRRIYKISPKLFNLVTVVAHEGVVLLVGVVPDPEWVSAVEREVWATEGVQALDNKLVCGEELTASRVVQDGCITSAVKTEMLFLKNVKSMNYKIITVNGEVYVVGIAQNAAELDRVLGKIRMTSGVTKVISTVRVKGGNARG